MDDGVFQRIARFEEGVDGESLAWLGGGAGLAVAVGGTLAVAALAPPAAMIAFASESNLLGKACFVGWGTCLAVVVAFWKRHRLAAHFQAAHRRLDSAAPEQRQRGLTEMLINARRGQAEHRRIARALGDYLRRPPHEQPDEPGRRQLAFSMLADQTLAMRAKEGIDLSGAVLAGVRGVGAELPGVRLRGADLTGAKLARANLRGADLREARLEGADLTGAQVDGAMLPENAGRSPRA